METEGQATGAGARWRWRKRLGLARPEHMAWAMYDWANSAYATVIMAAILPPFFARYYAADLAPHRATAFYAALVACALLATALLSPLLGAWADLRAAKKRALVWTTCLGAVACFGLAATGRGQLAMASFWTALAALAFGLSLVFYEGLLPGLARDDELDRLSAAGYALGYLGGGLLLAFDALLIMKPAWFGLADAATATRWALLLVGVWWLLFALPLLRRVPEPGPGQGGAAGGEGVFRRLLATLRNLRAHRDVLLFLAAFWCYNDGIGTIIRMAAIYGAEVGIGTAHLLGALLITQAVAFPFAFLFGQLGARRGPRAGIQLALAVYCGITVLGALMSQAWHFYVLAILVGTVQGGAQALSRSLFARMVPRARAGEFFGFFSVSSKFAAILGPGLFAVISYVAGSSRLAVLSMVLFFAVGMLLLRRVDVARAEACARGACGGRMTASALH